LSLAFISNPLVNGPVPYVTTAFWESEQGSTCYEGGGHYTQMLWNLTTDVGCAKTNCGGMNAA
jgi:hypothetical protein